jgi:hypothetical protein
MVRSTNRIQYFVALFFNKTLVLGKTPLKHNFSRENLGNSQLSRGNSLTPIYLCMNEGSLLVFSLSHSNLPNHGSSYCALGIVGKPLMTKGALR